MITIKDLARDTGYTVATVSRAMNNSPLVAQSTRERILEAARRIGYSPNAIARGLVNKSSSAVGIVVPDIMNPYFPTIVKAAQDVLSERGMFTIVCNSDWSSDNELQLVKMLNEHRVCGIIMDPLNDVSIQRIKDVGIDIPIVCVGNQVLEGNTSSVIIDNYNSAQKATEHLIQIGHERIAFYGGDEGTYILRRRCEGYRESMLAHFGSIDESLVCKCRYRQEDGYAATQLLIDEDNLPTAVLAANDIIAYGIILCLRDNGFSVPDDVSIIGFDDIEFSSIIELTTMREPRYDMGVMAAKVLCNEIEYSEDDKIPPKTNIQYPPELIIRSSCAPPRAVQGKGMPETMSDV